MPSAMGICLQAHLGALEFDPNLIAEFHISGSQIQTLKILMK